MHHFPQEFAVSLEAFSKGSSSKPSATPHEQEVSSLCIERETYNSITVDSDILSHHCASVFFRLSEEAVGY